MHAEGMGWGESSEWAGGEENGIAQMYGLKSFVVKRKDHVVRGNLDV